MFCIVVSAQENITSDFDRQTYIRREIEKQRVRLNSADTEERRDAVLRLGWIKTAESSSAAVVALNDSSDVVRAAATQAILALPAEEAVNFLIPLLKDKSELVRQETAYALGKTLSQSVVSNLIAVFNNEKEKPSVRGAVAISLGLVGDISVIPSLTQVLQNTKNTNPFVRASIIRSLGKLRAKDSVTILIAILSDERADPEVRRAAAWSLGGLRDVSALPALSNAMSSSDPTLSEIARKSFNIIKLELKN